MITSVRYYCPSLSFKENDLLSSLFVVGLLVSHLSLYAMTSTLDHSTSLRGYSKERSCSSNSIWYTFYVLVVARENWETRGQQTRETAEKLKRHRYNNTKWNIVYSAFSKARYLYCEFKRVQILFSEFNYSP